MDFSTTISVVFVCVWVALQDTFIRASSVKCSI